MLSLFAFKPIQIMEEKKDELFTKFSKLKKELIIIAQEDSGTIKEDVTKLLEKFEMGLRKKAKNISQETIYAAAEKAIDKMDSVDILEVFVAGVNWMRKRS